MGSTTSPSPLSLQDKSSPSLLIPPLLGASPRWLLLAGEPRGCAATAPASTVKRPSAVWITRRAFSSSGAALATTSAALTFWVVQLRRWREVLLQEGER